MTGPRPLDRDDLERRRFCRIDDEVILHFCQVRSDGAPAQATSMPFLLVCRLGEQREHVRNLLRELRAESPRVSRCLSALDERMALLETALLLEQIGPLGELRRSVKLSAGGLSVRTGASYGRDAVLMLEMILLPTLTGIISRGRVLRSVRLSLRDGEPPFLTTIEFVDMKESTRDLIARHVLARQGRRGR